MSNTEQAPSLPAGATPAPGAPPPSPLWVSDKLVEEFRQKAVDILERLSVLDEHRKALATQADRLRVLEEGQDTITGALHAVTETVDSVTEAVRKADHALQQTATQQGTTEAAAKAHASTNALGQDVLGALAWVAQNLNDLRASQNREWHGGPPMPEALKAKIAELGLAS